VAAFIRIGPIASPQNPHPSPNKKDPHHILLLATGSSSHSGLVF